MLKQCKQLKIITMKTIEKLSDKFTIPFCLIFFGYLMYQLAKALINSGI